MVDPNQGLAGGTFRMWREQTKLSQPFVDEQRKQVAEAFDYIICLKANKQKVTKCNAESIAAATGE